MFPRDSFAAYSVLRSHSGPGIASSPARRGPASVPSPGRAAGGRVGKKARSGAGTRQPATGRRGGGAALGGAGRPRTAVPTPGQRPRRTFLSRGLGRYKRRAAPRNASEEASRLAGVRGRRVRGEARLGWALFLLSPRRGPVSDTAWPPPGPARLRETLPLDKGTGPGLARTHNERRERVGWYRLGVPHSVPQCATGLATGRSAAHSNSTLKPAGTGLHCGTQRQGEGLGGPSTATKGQSRQSHPRR